MAELKPCPFCGRKMKLVTRHDKDFGDMHVLTHADDAQIMCVLYRGLIWTGSVKDFAELWNRRAKHG